MAKRKMVLLAATSAVLGTLATSIHAEASQTLDTVKKRGVLTCGVSSVLAGFGMPDSHATMPVSTSTPADSWRRRSSPTPRRSSMCR